MKYYAKKITPLFQGSPEWIVIDEQERLIAWCVSANDAAQIAKALTLLAAVENVIW